MKLFEYEGDSYHLMLCPNCGNDYVHFSDVLVESRSEDQTQALYAHVPMEEHTSDSMMRSGLKACETSSRRSGVKFRLRCEGCGKSTVVVFSSHKGQILVEGGREF